mgnify:CR=1 FL=1|tara:strand:+ start:162437 stop:162703 length:267 start_codon:yes stop_codon:yes gene_type:complete
MDERFKKLYEQLEQEDWPRMYFFKFIAPSDSRTIALVTNIFEDENNITLRPSKKGNYTSISVKEVMMSAEAVISVYEKAAKIKGVISL